MDTAMRETRMWALSRCSFLRPIHLVITPACRSISDRTFEIAFGNNFGNPRQTIVLSMGWPLKNVSTSEVLFHILNNAQQSRQGWIQVGKKKFDRMARSAS